MQGNEAVSAERGQEAVIEESKPMAGGGVGVKSDT